MSGVGGGSVVDGGLALPGSTNRASHARPRPRSVSSGGSGERRGSRGGANDDDSVCVSNEGNNDNGGGLSFRSIISSASFASLPRAGERTAPAYHKDKVEEPTTVSQLNSVNGSATSSGKGCGFVRDLYCLKQVYIAIEIFDIEYRRIYAVWNKLGIKAEMQCKHARTKDQHRFSNIFTFLSLQHRGLCMLSQRWYSLIWGYPFLRGTCT